MASPYDTPTAPQPAPPASPTVPQATAPWSPAPWPSTPSPQPPSYPSPYGTGGGWGAPPPVGGGGGYGYGSFGNQPPAQPPRQKSKGPWVAVGVLFLALLVGAFFAGIGLQRMGAPAAYSRQPQATTPVTPGQGRSGPPTTTPGATGSVDDPNAIANAVNPGVVDVVSRLPEGIGAGTGMVLTSDGEILTNNHVVDGADAIQVTITSSGDTYTASIVGTNPSEDVAVLKLDGASGLQTIPIGDSDTVKPGDPIVALGNAGGQGGTPIVVTGTVIALHQQITASEQNGSNQQTLDDTIQVNANIEPGDSGGPLVNTDGKVIGMNSAAAIGGRRRTTTHAGFAIPINHAIDVANAIKANPNGGNSSANSNRGYLGVQVATTQDGATVRVVTPNSPASKVGIQAGDVITSVNNGDVASAQDLTEALSNDKPGDQVTVTWESADGQHQEQVTLGGR